MRSLVWVSHLSENKEVTVADGRCRRLLPFDANWFHDCSWGIGRSIISGKIINSCLMMFTDFPLPCEVQEGQGSLEQQHKEIWRTINTHTIPRLRSQTCLAIPVSYEDSCHSAYIWLGKSGSFSFLIGWLDPGICIQPWATPPGRPRNGQETQGRHTCLEAWRARKGVQFHL